MGRDYRVPLNAPSLSATQRRIQQNFKRGFGQYNDNAYMQKHIANTLVDLFAQSTNRRHFQNALEIGCGTGFLTQGLVPRLCVDHWTINDLVEDSKTHITPILTTANWDFLPGAIETKQLPGNYNLIVSASVFQWIEDTPNLLKKLSDNLAPGGWLVFSSFAQKHFHELRSFDRKPTTMSYFNNNEIHALLPNDLALKHIEQETHIVKFNSVRDLLMHLRNTGVNAKSQQQWSRQRLATFEQKYSDRFSDQEKKICLSYAPIYVIAQKQ